MSAIVQADCLDVIPGLDADSFDAIVTDPPYGLAFMGKHWDHGVPGIAYWRAALRVAKAGTYLLAFGGTRTYHRLACAVEDAGWEIQDSLCWLYGSGFPKHKSKLKPAHEPIVMARKPAPRATLLNIDACRLEHDGSGIWGNHGQNPANHRTEPGSSGTTLGTGWTRPGSTRHEAGRWPANVCVDEEAAAMIDAQSGVLTSGQLLTHHKRGGESPIGTFKMRDRTGEPCNFGGDTGGASRFFFVAREPNAATPNDPLILRRAKAILWAWNPELANTADDHSSLSNEHAVSVLSRVAIAASHGATQLSGLTGLSTSVTPSELRTLCESVIALTLSSASESSHEQQRGRRIPSNGHANGAAASEPTGITTATIGRSTFDGSAVVATLQSTSNSSEHGEADSRSSRLLYCAKASRSEREAGLEGQERRPLAMSTVAQSALARGETRNVKGDIGLNDVRHVRNNHPTVKPVALMRWLVRLVTPPDGLVLDPFAGSGTTGIAAVLEGRRFLGIEREAEYVEIARARIAHAQPALGVA